MRAAFFVFAMSTFACASRDAHAPPPTPEPTVMPDALEVTLLPADALTADHLELRMRVKNPTSKPQKFCTYHTLFEGLRNDLFEVKRADGSALEYRGMMAKRAPPDADDFITLAPGEARVSDAVDVSEGYAFTPGTFSVVFTGGSISGLPASKPLSLTVK